MNSVTTHCFVGRYQLGYWPETTTELCRRS